MQNTNQVIESYRSKLLGGLSHALALLVFFVLLKPAESYAITYTVNANDYPVGTEITNVAPDATLEWYEHPVLGDTILKFPSFIDSVPCDNELPDPNCSFKALGGADESGTGNNDEYDAYLNGAISLMDAGPFVGLSISFEHRATSFGFTAFSNSGDIVALFLFDDSDNYLDTLLSPLIFRDPNCGSETDCSLYAETFDLSGYSVSRVAIGSGSAAVYVDSISYSSIPIPPAFYLFGAGLTGLIGLARRKAN